MPSSEDFRVNIERFSGFADTYDQSRPSPPDALADLLSLYSGRPALATVVDLGSGTGLSTRYWADKAAAVIGIEATADMRARAIGETKKPNVTFRDALSHRTGLEDRSVDVVVCGQSLHWMEPQPTFVEAARILRPGGVFAAYDYDWPPSTGAWQADQAFEECIDAGKRLEHDLQASVGLKHFEKSGHLERMRSSGCFRYMRELSVHHNDTGNAERLVGLLLSQGHIMTLLKRGITESALGIDRLRLIAAQTLDDGARPWHWSARVRLGVVS
ncbi:MAG: class I SAM-dependent methyltransferase [Steroidobacteraceae bacterium]